MAVRTILFPTDFSARCDLPRERALQLAREHGASLVLLHVVGTAEAALSAAGRAAVETKLRAEAEGEGIAVETRLGFGEAWEAIVQSARDAGADLIVTGISRHDEISDYVVGTTVERVMRHAQAPVLVVKAPVRQEYRRLMVATDFSDCSAAAVQAAMDLFPDAEPTLLHAYRVPLEALRGREGPAPELQAEIAFELDTFLNREEIGQRARERLDVSIDYGETCRVARDHVEANNTDIAVIGTHGRTGLAAAVLGSTARALLACLDCDVLLVRGSG